MYKEKVDVKAYDNKLQTVNIETAGKKSVAIDIIFVVSTVKIKAFLMMTSMIFMLVLIAEYLLMLITKKFIAKIIAEERIVSNEIIRSL